MDERLIIVFESFEKKVVINSSEDFESFEKKLIINSSEDSERKNAKVWINHGISLSF